MGGLIVGGISITIVVNQFQMRNAIAAYTRDGRLDSPGPPAGPRTETELDRQLLEVFGRRALATRRFRNGSSTSSGREPTPVRLRGASSGRNLNNR
jgi:hypothetical protein